MTAVIVLAVLFILVGIIRALRSRGADGDAPDETGDEEGFDAKTGDAPEDDAPGDDAPGDDAPGDGAPRDDAPGDDAPGDDAPPEKTDCVSAPPWAVYPDAQWELRDMKPHIWLGEASPTMMEMFKRVPEAEPDAPVDGWVMPEADPALMEDPEDYGIDNGDPDEPMWTPPEPPSASAQPEKPPRKWVNGIFVFWMACLVRTVFDGMYLLQRALQMQKGESGSFQTGFQLSIPGGLEIMGVAAGALLLVDIVVLVFITRRSDWIKAAFLIYVLFDLGLRAMDFMNGLRIGGQLLDMTLVGVALAASYDLVCALYVLTRPDRTPEESDE